MKKKLIVFVTLILMIVPQFKVKAVSDPNILAESAILMDANTGQILYQKNENVKYEPASTTKIITALIALEKANLTDKVVIGNKPPYEIGSKIYLQEGEELTVDQLVNALLIVSANDAALALAEHISGSKEAFAKLMNEKARSLGCKNTNFVNPNGLPEENHYTTAYDLAIISREAMKNPVFRNIVSTKSYQIPPTNKQDETRYLYNHNKLLFPGKYQYEAADGIKTGYTGSARFTFVGSATKDSQRLIGVILKSESQAYYYEDVKRLFEYGFNNFSYTKILSKNDEVSNLSIKSSPIEIPVYPQEEVYYTSKKDEEPVVTKNIELNNNIENLDKGDIVGSLNIKINDSFERKVPLVAGEAYRSSLYNLKAVKPGEYDRKLKTSIKYMSAISFFAFFIISGFVIKLRRRQRYKRRNAYKNSKLF